jgi:hypothetical protein
MPYCPKCGTQNPDTAKFCSNCGASLEALTEPIPEQVPSNVIASPSSGVGARVSFKASDGKTYTGTIEEVKGEKYRIKYDAVDFETWLTRDQFSYIGSNGNLPVYTAAPSAQIVSSNTATGSQRSTPFFLTRLSFWGSGLIIIGFFTPWMSVGDYGGITGLNILTSINDVNVSESDPDHMFLLTEIATITVLVSALICMAYSLGIKIGRGAFIFFKILPLLCVIGYVAYFISKTQGGPENPIHIKELGEIIGIGIYLIAAGSLILAISPTRK